MMHVVSKLAWIALQPSNALLFMLVLGVLLAFTRWRRLGRALAALATAALLAVLLLPVHAWVLQPLEERFPQSLPPAGAVDGIVVLGGAIDAAGSDRRHGIELNANAERLTAFMALARRYPQAQVVFTGGSGALAPRHPPGAAFARALFAGLGLDIDRVSFEGGSRNTYENAVRTYELLRPGAGETWLLVTSARHMPRAIGVFRRVGWNAVPYPVDYRGSTAQSFEQSLDLAGKLHDLDGGVKEWIGLIAYWLLGRTESFLPAPLRA